MHKKRWAISTEQLNGVETMSGLGLSQEDIAHVLGVSKDTLERELKKNAASRAAIDSGRALAKLNVSKSAYEMAVSGKLPTMTQFWLKCRAGWKDQEAATTININANERVSRVVDELDADKLLKIMLQLRSLPPEAQCNLAQISSQSPSDCSPPSSLPPSHGEQ